MIFQTTSVSIINFLLCTVLPPGASEVNQTQKFYDFFDLATVLLDLTGQYFDCNERVNNVIYNNFV